MQGDPSRAGVPSGASPQALRAVRQELALRVLDRSLPASYLPARYSEAADYFLTALFDKTAGTQATGYTVVAVGGYGRRELCPGSDLDVVLLHDSKRDVREVAEAIWYEIWDSGIRLDHSVRTPKEMLAVAGEDLRAMLGLLDGRVVCGDQGLGEGALTKVGRLFTTAHRRVLPQLAAASLKRHQSFGELAFLLEPDLKESAGGLRDLEVMTLVARAMPHLADVIRPSSLDEAHELLLSARVALHARTGNASDRLLLQEQDDIAAVLGFVDADAFASALTAQARQVVWAWTDGWCRTESALAGPGARSAGRETKVGRQIVMRDGEIAVATDADIAADPSLVLRVATAAAAHEVPICIATLKRLAAERPPLGDPWPELLRDAFVSLLEHGHGAIAVIETLDRWGLLAWLLPEWAAVRHRPQRNAYHRFTVDRHLLETAAEAARLLRNVERPDLLLIAALLHDIGKGHTGDHSEVGRELAARIARRMGYESRDVAVIERVVKRHLLLADTATRRDLDDPETTELVAEAVGDRLTLELLAALTEADSIATGPAAWGSWKASLVLQLVSNVRALLEGRTPESTPARHLVAEVAALVDAGELALRIDGSKVTVVAPDRPGLFALVAGTLVMHRLDIRSAAALEVGAAALRDGTHPMAVEIFDVALDAERPLDDTRLLADLASVLRGELPLAAHLRTLEQAYARYRRPAAAHGPEVVVLIDEASSPATSVVEVRAPDSHGLLHRLAWTLAGAGLDVVSARIATLGHEAVDSFYVRDTQSGARPSRQRLEELRDPLTLAAHGSPDAILRG
ncbi:MAG: [protein-PII] uridylyltransferase [Acidimicrobiales bacterium]